MAGRGGHADGHAGLAARRCTASSPSSPVLPMKWVLVMSMTVLGRCAVAQHEGRQAGHLRRSAVIQLSDRALAAAGDQGQQPGVGTGGPPCRRQRACRRGARSSRPGWQGQGAAPLAARGPAFFGGGPAPDAVVLPSYQGVGQAVRLHRAAAADGLRRADLRQRRTRHRNGKEKLRILAAAGAVRHPARGTSADCLQRGGHGTSPAV